MQVKADFFLYRNVEITYQKTKFGKKEENSSTPYPLKMAVLAEKSQITFFQLEVLKNPLGANQYSTTWQGKT